MKAYQLQNQNSLLLQHLQNQFLWIRVRAAVLWWNIHRWMSEVPFKLGWGTKSVALLETTTALLQVKPPFLLSQRGSFHIIAQKHHGWVWKTPLFDKNSKILHLTLRLHNYVPEKSCSTSLVNLLIFSATMQITTLAFSKSSRIIRLTSPIHTEDLHKNILTSIH